jgi:hypothetical protein
MFVRRRRLQLALAAVATTAAAAVALAGFGNGTPEARPEPVPAWFEPIAAYYGHDPKITPQTDFATLLFGAGPRSSGRTHGGPTPSKALEYADR